MQYKPALYYKKKGISVEVINNHTIQPLDEAAVFNSIRKNKMCRNCREHNIIGGLGDAIAQCAVKNFPIPIEYVGTKDTFGESGTPAQLLKKYGLRCAGSIVAAAEKSDGKKIVSKNIPYA
jgi:transketolase